MNKEKKRNFDQESTNWDQVPGRVKVAEDIARSMIHEITLTPDMDVLDFGCGTGLLTFALQPFVNSITGVDSSQGMLDIFRKNAKEQNLQNAKAEFVDLEKGDVMRGSFHLIVSSMTLHHIKNISSLFKQFHSLLLPAGQLAVADLEPDDGQFHSNNEGVFHFGFDRKTLYQMYTDTGFRDVRHLTAAQVEKPVEGGQTRLFEIFLIIGRK